MIPQLVARVLSLLLVILTLEMVPFPCPLSPGGPIKLNFSPAPPGCTDTTVNVHSKALVKFCINKDLTILWYYEEQSYCCSNLLGSCWFLSQYTVYVDWTMSPFPTQMWTLSSFATFICVTNMPPLSHSPSPPSSHLHAPIQLSLRRHMTHSLMPLFMHQSWLAFHWRASSLLIVATQNSMTRIVLLVSVGCDQLLQQGQILQCGKDWRGNIISWCRRRGDSTSPSNCVMCSACITQILVSFGRGWRV